MRAIRLGLISAACLAALAGTGRSQGTVAEVQVAPGVITLTVGHSRRLVAAAYDASGAAIVSGVRYRWVSANVNVARVDSTGQVTAVAPGSALIRAEASGGTPPKSGAATVTVRRP